MYNSISIFRPGWRTWSRYREQAAADDFVIMLPVTAPGNHGQQLGCVTAVGAASQVINSSMVRHCQCGLMFLAALTVWAFSLMFLFSGRGLIAKLIRSISCFSR